jgi:hypothetical protein
MEELGMEAVWKIRVENFPAFIIVDDKGNDFFKEFSTDDATVPPEVNSSIYSVLEFFETVDKNHDQMLEPSELVDGFTNLSLQDATQLVLKYDLGGFGGLNLDEFLTMVMKEEEIVLYVGDETAKQKLLAAD